MTDVAIIGGGLAGLINAILIRKAGFDVVLFEEKAYPFHRVCGEYVSNEVVPFLRKHDLFPDHLKPASITKFKMTSISGKSLEMELDLGGFGVSRYTYDHWLANKAKDFGVLLKEQERVNEISFIDDNYFDLQTSKEVYKAKVVIGAYGKRSKLDKQLRRTFVQKRSPYVGVKYHIKTKEVEGNNIELHNFDKGYCGVSKVDGGIYNLCYLSHRDNLKTYKDVMMMEKEVLFKNPHLVRIFSNSEFLFEKPQVINEISFSAKEPVFDHVLMSGDTAGVIAPLCGNGMAMAIHSTKFLSELVEEFLKGNINRAQLEDRYRKNWNDLFAIRLKAGRKIQYLFGSNNLSEMAVTVGKLLPSISRFLMKQTHGSVFS